MTMAVAGAAVAAGLVVAGCSSTIEGRAQPVMETGTVNAVDVTGSPDTSEKSPTTTSSAPTTTTTGGDVSFDAEIGACVALGGTTTDASIEEASCGSNESNYKVIGKAEQSTQCVSDADNYYAESRNGIEMGALCLDIDWVIGGCMDVGGGATGPERIDCTATSAADGVKVVAIEENAEDVSACGSGSSGYVYPERRFVVCVEEL
ncbi:LppU family putative lipoprotein [Nocardia sp. NBC_00416]|uniref:LppU family putative lipoprotein n=1 Tax=Nocardia sp. NBC_00416 TaxID=2975991 RepID=UPI002E23D15A